MANVQTKTGPGDNAARRLEDAELARRCVAGDRPAQQWLFRREVDRVHVVLYRVLGPTRDLEDLVQEAFLEVFRSLASFRGDALLATWIDRVTARVAYAYLSRRKPQTAWLEAVPEPASGAPSAERRVLDREAARRFYRELDRLDVKMRIAFSLHAIDGRELTDVARVMDATLAATKARVWRARRELERRARGDTLLAAFLREGRGGT